MKTFRTITLIVLAMSLLLAACKPAATQTPAPTLKPTVAPTEISPTEPPPPAGLTCAEPVKIGLITDASGPLAIYGAHILRSFMLGMEYATGAAGSAGAKEL